jgi:hypothetical protein
MLQNYSGFKKLFVNKKRFINNLIDQRQLAFSKVFGFINHHLTYKN